MCGGIVTAFGLSMRDQSTTQRAILIGSYHGGLATQLCRFRLVGGLDWHDSLESVGRYLLPRGVLAVVLIVLG